MAKQNKERSFSGSNLINFAVVAASIILIVLVAACACVRGNYESSVFIERLLYLIFPLAVINIGYFISVKIKKYSRYILSFGKYFLVPLLFSCVYLFSFYLLFGSVKGAFSRFPIEIATENPFSASNAILYRFLWDIGYSGLAALIVASVTPGFARAFVAFHDKVYEPILVILGGEAEPPERKIYTVMDKLKAFILLNTFFSIEVILLLPKLTTSIYVEVVSPYGNYISPDPMLFMSIAPVLASTLIEIREHSSKTYWSYLKFIISVLSVSNAISFVLSPLAQTDFLNLLQIAPGILLYNVIGVSIFSITFKEELVTRLSRKKKIFLAFFLVTGFVIFLTAGWIWRDLFWGIPSSIAYMLSNFLDSLGVSATIYAFCLILQRITHFNCYPKTLLLQSIGWMMLVGMIYALSPSDTPYAVVWSGILVLNLILGFTFFFFPRAAFFLAGLSLVLAVVLFRSFGWAQIITTVGSILLSLKLRTMRTQV